jgi:predicted nucleotide-binding protein (sugar kinase/HSP70/actin superfamily)
MANEQMVHKPNVGIKFLIPFIFTLAVALVSSSLLAQSWAKDTRYALLEQKIEHAASTSLRNEMLNNEHEKLLRDLSKINERLVANQENMQKQLDRIERKLP